MAKFLSKDGKFYMRNGKLLQYIVPVSKTWVINETPDVSTDMLVTINFTSNGKSFDQFQIDSVVPGIIYLKNGSDVGGYQYDSASWGFGETYRTVVFETAPTGELLTWLQANAVPQADVPVSKTWVINETPDLTNDMYVHINFTSRGISYKQFVIESSKLYYDNSPVCDDIGFVKEAFRTVVFETAPTGELLTWLQANAVPQ